VQEDDFIIPFFYRNIIVLNSGIFIGKSGKLMKVRRKEAAGFCNALS